MKLDQFDRQLLDLVQQDSSRTAEQLSEVVALSASAIQRRLRKLKDAGVIVRETAVVSPQHVGRPTFFLVSLQVERERPELMSRLRGWLSDEEHIQQAFYVTGEADFVLVVTAPDAEAFDVFMTRLMVENPNVRRFTTNVTLALVKRGLSVPIPTLAE